MYLFWYILLFISLSLSPALPCFLPSGRNGKMRVLSFKTGLVSLCNADVQEKYKCKYETLSCRHHSPAAP